MTSADHRLVLAAVQAGLAPDGPAAFATALQAPVDWHQVLRIASRHQVLPLVHQALVCLEGDGAVPASGLAALQQRLYAIVARNRILAAELRRVLDLATGAGVRMLPFKGPVLATTLYGGLALRQFDDLDLLIEREHLSTGADFLVSLGYRLRDDHGWAATFVHDRNRICIDLHGGLARPHYPIPVDFSRVWARRQPVSIQGRLLDTLSLEDTLVFLCLQAARDAWSARTKLAKISDIAHALRRSAAIDWGRVDAEVSLLGARRMLEFGVALAVRVLLVATPPRFAGAQTRAVAALVRQEEGLLFEEPAERASSSIRGPLLHFCLRERWRDRLRPFAGRVSLLKPTQGDRALVRLPRWLSWAYYVIRPARLVITYGPVLLGRIRSRPSSDGQ